MRKAISLIVVLAFLVTGNAAAVQYLAPRSAVQDNEALEDFSRTVDTLGSAKDKKGIPVTFIKDDFVDTVFVSRERFLKLRSENKIAPVLERIVVDPDTGEAAPGEAYVDNDAIAYLLENGIIKKAYTSPRTFRYVSTTVVNQLLEIGLLRYALMDRQGAASYKGDAVLVHRDGLQNIDLRRGVRMHAVSLLVESVDTPGAEEIVRSAFDIADERYGNTMTDEGQYLIDEALSLAMTVTEPVDVKVGPELAAAALLFAVDLDKIPVRQGIDIPNSVWGWVKKFQELNSLDFNPPLTMKPKVREVYIENFRNYLTKYAGGAVQPLLLLMAYRMNHFFAAREEMGSGFYERYDLLINVYAMLAEQLGLKRFSDSMNRLSYRRAHEKEYRAILRQLNKTFGVYYQDLSVFADIFREQVAREIKELEKKTGRKIEAEVDFGVKDPGSIDEKIKFYAKKRGLSLKNPLDGIADLEDLVRGRVIVRNREDLALMRKLPFAQKISPGETLRATAVARKITGKVPTIEDVVDRKTLQDIFHAHRSPVAVKEALARLAQASADGKAPLFVELQMQTADMRRKEFTGAVLHSFYKMRKLGFDLLPPREVYEKTSDLAERLRSINREPQVADIEFIRCKYHRRMKDDEERTVEFIHNVPKRLSDREDQRPAVIDVLTRREMGTFRNCVLKPVKILVNGRAVKDFGERVSTADVVEIQAGEPDPALQERLGEIARYVEGGKDAKRAAYAALPAGNTQSQVAVTLLLEDVPDAEIEHIYRIQLDLLKARIASGMAAEAPLSDDDIRSYLEQHNMTQWSFRRSSLLQELCLGMHFGLVDPADAVSAVFAGRGRKLMEDAGVDIPPDADVRAILRPLNIFTAAITAKEMAIQAAIEAGKGNISVEAIRELLIRPLTPPAPLVPVTSPASPAESAA